MLHLNKLKSKAIFLNLYITSTQFTRICCSAAIFNMCYATSAIIQPDLFKLSENDFRGLHLHNLESLQRYFTLHSHNLTFTTLVQFDFRVLHLYNLKSLWTIWFCILHLYTMNFITFIQLDFRVLHFHNLKSLSLW